MIIFEMREIEFKISKIQIRMHLRVWRLLWSILKKSKLKRTVPIKD